MGRRAKNKQAAPIAFQEVKQDYSRPSAKKLGKRKADSDETIRPTKKAKESDSRTGDKPKPKTSIKSKTVKKEKKVSKQDADESEGWEDVEDDIDLKAQAK